jgi:hypothetical protein
MEREGARENILGTEHGTLNGSGLLALCRILRKKRETSNNSQYSPGHRRSQNNKESNKERRAPRTPCVCNPHGCLLCSLTCSGFCTPPSARARIHAGTLVHVRARACSGVRAHFAQGTN